MNAESKSFAELVHPGFFIPNFCKNQTVQLTPGCSQNKTRLCIIHSASGDGRSSGLLLGNLTLFRMFLSLYFHALSISKYRYTLFNKKKNNPNFTVTDSPGFAPDSPLRNAGRKPVLFSCSCDGSIPLHEMQGRNTAFAQTYYIIFLTHVKFFIRFLSNNFIISIVILSII